MPEVKWFQVGFSFGSWIECECGFRPYSEEEYEKHFHKEN